MNTENSNTIKVILRSRPTQNFATKNIVLDAMDNVIKLIFIESNEEILILINNIYFII